MEKEFKGEAEGLAPCIYFVGAGGIGMAALERYCLSRGLYVAGYDRTPSALTEALESEGVCITFEDNPAEIPAKMRNPEDTLVVYTPAVPNDNAILAFFRKGGFKVMKRSELLGRITRQSRAICVAGSHGKTTTSSMIANILRQSHVGCNAFLGGILRNTGSNLTVCPDSEWSVAEADEYDRSFLRLTPEIAVITSTDPDHLDIYGDEACYLDAFRQFTSLIRPGGTLILHTGLKMLPDVVSGVVIETYSANDNEADWHAEDITFGYGTLTFTLCGPEGFRMEGISPGVPVEINIDNAVAAAAAALRAGATEEEVRNGLAGFMGARRRFEIWIGADRNRNNPVLIDDYAHSPGEVAASIASVRKLFPGRKLSVVFQPHLYSRTRDFASGFAKALSSADEVILTEIYPARELPIDGVNSQLIFKDIENADKMLCERKDLLDLVKNRNFEILMTLGAADLDRLLPDISRLLKEKSE